MSASAATRALRAVALPGVAPVQLPSETSDLDAVAGVIAGHRELFEIIVRRHNPRLFRVGMAYLRSHAQTEDAMQNTYVKAFLNLGRFQRGAAFSTWLTRIMINECLMVLRRRKTAPEAPDDFLPFELPALLPEASEHLHLQETKSVLEQAISALPRNYRTVYMLREIEHLTTAETAACLGLSAHNVKVRLMRARERLKAELLKSAAGAELFSYPAVFCNRMTARVLRAVQALP